MRQMIGLAFAGVLVAAGAVAGTDLDERRVDHDASAEAASEKAGSQHDQVQKEQHRDHERKDVHDEKEGPGTMGAGATGTTGGMGATTGTDTIE